MTGFAFSSPLIMLLHREHGWMGGWKLKIMFRVQIGF